jgi:HD-GYP domain-containing protein (c-di-GMP phosphodiesterase class II)
MVRAHPDDDEPPALCWLRNPLTSGVMIRAAQAGRSVHVESIAQSSLMHEHERDLWHDGRLLVVPMTVQENVMGVAVLHRDETADDFGAVDVKRVTELVRVMAPAVRTARLHHRQRCQMYATLEGIADAVESRDLYLRGHSGRVLAYATPLSLGMELPQCQVGALQIAARLHDIGRIAIPDMAVNHPGPLTDEQWQAVRAHPETGAAFLKPLDFFGEVGEIIRSHHESYDGTGYPNLKAGEEIHVVARVIAVADAFDAMTSHRPYRDAMTVAAARDQIARLAGQQFDPHIAEAFLALPEDLLASIQTSCR